MQNKAEIDAVLNIVRRFDKEGKEYRIITPYDAQRAALEKALKNGGLRWENRCFCVDSFQGKFCPSSGTPALWERLLTSISPSAGNEADHIILSVVRSEKVGFLSNQRRSNVMLSRCKKSLTICTNLRYLQSTAKDTLLGHLADEWGSTAWVSYRDLLSGNW